MPTMSLDLPAELADELRDTAASTGIPMARLVRDGVRLRLDQLSRPSLFGRFLSSAWTPPDGTRVYACQTPDCSARHAATTGYACERCLRPTAWVGTIQGEVMAARGELRLYRCTTLGCASQVAWAGPGECCSCKKPLSPFSARIDQGPSAASAGQSHSDSARIVEALRRYAEYHEACGNETISSRVRECLDVLPSDWESKGHAR